jgi:hypothetical protein
MKTAVLALLVGAIICSCSVLQQFTAYEENNSSDVGQTSNEKGRRIPIPPTVQQFER